MEEENGGKKEAGAAVEDRAAGTISAQNEESKINEQINAKSGKTSETFALEISSIMNHQDMGSMLAMQHIIYRKLQESNQALRTFNDFSAKQYSVLGPQFEKNTKQLKEMKRDLDQIFKRIQTLRDQVRRMHPVEAEKALAELGPPPDVEED